MKTKNLILILLLLIFGAGFSQSNENIFKDNPPGTSPAIFLASMPPCLIGVAHQYGSKIGISKKTLNMTDGFIKEALKKVPELKNEVRELELKIMKASKEERYKDYEKLLHQLANVKIKASLFHEGLVKRARKKFSKTDVEKLDVFILNNKEVFFKTVKLNK